MNRRKPLKYTILGFTILAIGSLVYPEPEPEPEPELNYRPVKPTVSKTESKASKFLNLTTARLIATTAKKYPKTLMAIASVETGRNGTNKTVGDKGEALGLFQVQERHWGEVSDDPEQQVLQAEEVLEILVEKYGYRRGVEKYNGEGEQARAYRKKVLDRVAMLERR